LEDEPDKQKPFDLDIFMQRMPTARFLIVASSVTKLDTRVWYLKATRREIYHTREER